MVMHMDIITEPNPLDEIQVEPETCCEDPVNNHKIYEHTAKHGQHSEGKNKLKKICTVFKLFNYADNKNKTMLLISFIASIVNGILTPINASLILAPTVALFIEEERKYYNDSGNNFQDDTSNKNLSDTLVDFGYNFYWIGAASFVLGFIQIALSEKSSQNILANIKTDYLAKLLSINIAWYDKCEDQFVNTVSYDLQKMKGIFDSRMTTAIEIISFFICGNIFGFVGSVKVAAITFAVLLISLAMVYILVQLSKRQGRKQRTYNTVCTKLTAEVLGNARTVAAYGGELNEIKRFEGPFKTALKYGFKHAMILSVTRGFNYFMFCICYAVTFYVCTVFYRNADFDPVHLVMVLVAQISVIYHSTALLNTISDLFMAMDSAYKVMAVIDTESNFKSSSYDGECPKEFYGNIRFRNVAFSYPSNMQTRVLRSLTLDIEPGKITAVVGTSGAGKSTIVGLVTRLYDTLSGQITIDGINIRDLNVSWLRNQIGVVMQEPTLFDATIEDNIRFGKPDATREEIEAAAKLSYAHAFIKKLPAGYNSIVGERGVKLSGGQKQRIAIARALVRKPKLLLLDEATSALDTRSEEIVQEALDNAMKGRTTVIIAHRMTTVMKADVIYAMKDGEVLEKGSHDELIQRKGYYYALVKVQELENKDKAVEVIHQRQRKGKNMEEENEEMDEEDENLEQDDQLKKTTCFSLKNIQIWIMWFIALAFCCLISAFLPGFYYVYTLLCQTFSHEIKDIDKLAELNVILLVCVGVLAFIGVTGSDMFATKATYIWLNKMRRKAFRKIVSMDISWFDKNGNTPNETLEIVINSPVTIEGVLGDKAVQVIVFFMSLAFTLVYSFMFSLKISLVNLPIILVFIVINLWRVKAKSSDVKSSTHATKSSKIAIEYVQNVKTIQLLNCQKYVISQFQKLIKLSKKEAFKGVLYYAIVYGISKSLMRLAMGSTFVFGGPIIANGDIRGTQIIGIVVAMSTASVLAGPSLVLMSQYPGAKQALRRLYRIVNTISAIDVLSDKGQKPEIIGNIVFKNASFSYPTRQKVQVLNKLNLTIEAGKTTALVGNSGCGKSTIISLLERFYLPSGGNIIVDGVDIDDINVRYLRSQMGLVSQEPVLFDLSIKDNILYGLKEQVTDAQIMEAARIANIHDFIMKLPQAYDTMVGERGSKLSGGQKQRIAIARAVLRDPKILLLDEATSALDTESEKIVQEALENASVGRTTIVIAHRLSTIRKADKIAVLQAGVVVEQGTHDQLVERRGHYYSLLHQ